MLRVIMSFCMASLLAAVAACNAAGGVVAQGPAPAPNPILPEPRLVAHGNWDGDIQGFVGVQGVTALFQLKGHATVEFRAFGPTFLYIDGDDTFTITPTPGKEAEAVRAIDERAVVVIRNGINVGLRAPVRVAPPMPPPPPQPNPTIKLPIGCSTPVCRPGSAVPVALNSATSVEGECVGRFCSIPNTR